MDLLISVYTKIASFFGVIFSYIIALLRFVFISAIFIFSGIQQILFGRVEVVNAEMKALPLRCDREEAVEKVAYLDKLCLENPELLDLDIEDTDDIGDDEGEP